MNHPHADAGALSGSGYPRLLAGIGSWFTFWGGHAVVFQWLVVEVLAAPPEQVGSAQMLLQLPSLLFLLVGGAFADRVDPTREIVAIHLLTAGVVASLAIALWAQALGVALLMGYAVVLGTLQAFAFPARDTLLNGVTRGPLGRAVAGATLTQHAGQVIGALLAGSASFAGGVPVVLGLSLLVAAGAVPLGSLPRRPRAGGRQPLSIAELRAGVAEVFGSSVLRPVWLLSLVSGLLFVGPYFVLVPLLVRDVYAGGAAEIAILTAMFPLGSVIGGLAIVWRGGLRHTGRALALGMLIASACIGAIAARLPFAGTVVAVFGWGLAGALFINAGRTLFQSHASEAHRARVLSVYTLGVMGAAPLGSVAAGWLATPLGLHGALRLDAALALAISLAVIAATPLWRQR